MQRTRPLPGHPEFSVSDYPGYREYRVENWHVACDGRVAGRATHPTQYWAIVPVLFSLTPKLGLHGVVCLAVVTVLLLIRQCSQVVVESVLVIAPHGIQLETRRGIPSWPAFVSRRFIPSTALHDVIINEGLRGWNVRYYLAAVKEHPSSGFSLDVAFENILPRLPVLLEVYHGIHDLLLTAQCEEEKRC